MSTSEPSIAQRALHWGVVTWIGNFAGCLIGMVPIALPLSVVATVATLITGLVAMVLGVRGRRAAQEAGDERGAQDARLGFWLGTSHLIIVALVAAAAGAALHFDALGGTRILGH